MRKKILFVINTLSRAGAEMALLEWLRKLDKEDTYELSLFVLMGQGEMIDQLPPGVHVVNERYIRTSVLEENGKKQMYRTIRHAAAAHGNALRLSVYMIRALGHMIKTKRIQPDKLLWRMIADGAERQNETYDLAVAYLEGGSAYYVADHVNAKKKAAFIHIDYTQAGYTSRNFFSTFSPIGNTASNFV